MANVDQDGPQALFGISPLWSGQASLTHRLIGPRTSLEQQRRIQSFICWPTLLDSDFSLSSPVEVSRVELDVVSFYLATSHVVNGDFR